MLVPQPQLEYKL